MELQMVTLRVPVDVLKRVDAAAKVAGLTRTALLLRPWSGEGGSSPAAVAPVPAPRSGGVTVTRATKSKVTVVGSMEVKVGDRRTRVIRNGLGHKVDEFGEVCESIGPEGPVWKRERGLV